MNVARGVTNQNKQNTGRFDLRLIIVQRQNLSRSNLESSTKNMKTDLIPYEFGDFATRCNQILGKSRHNSFHIHAIRQEYYSVFDSGNAGSHVLITLRKKDREQLLLYPAVTYNTADMSDAVLISNPSKAKKIWTREFGP